MYLELGRFFITLFLPVRFRTSWRYRGRADYRPAAPVEFLMVYCTPLLDTGLFIQRAEFF
jgi:hypothetical protein